MHGNTAETAHRPNTCKLGSTWGNASLYQATFYATNYCASSCKNGTEESSALCKNTAPKEQRAQKRWREAHINSSMKDKFLEPAVGTALDSLDLSGTRPIHGHPPLMLHSLFTSSIDLGAWFSPLFRNRSQMA